MFQIGASKTVFRNLAHAAVLCVTTEKMRENRTDLRFSFAAVALDNHHTLSLVTGDETVADIFLKRGNVIFIKNVG